MWQALDKEPSDDWRAELAPELPVGLVMCRTGDAPFARRHLEPRIGRRLTAAEAARAAAVRAAASDAGVRHEQA